MTCPSAISLARWVEEREPNAGELAAHVQSCQACLGEVTRLRAVTQSLAAFAERVESSPSFVAAVVGRLEPRPRRSMTWVGAGLVLAAMFAVFVVRSSTEREGDLVARGEPTRRSDRFGVTFFAERGASSVRLSSGAPVSRDTGFSFMVRATQPVEVMLFGVDAAGQTHWFYPAFTDAGADPGSLHLTGSGALPEAVTADAAAAGPFVLIALFSENVVHVSEVERLLAEGGIGRLKRMPSVVLESLEVTHE